MRFRHVTLAVLVNIVWGVNFAIIDLGLRDLPPLLFCALRFGVAAVPAIFVVRRPGVAWRWVVAVGLALGVVKFGLLFAAMAAGMPAGLSAIVLQSQAVFSVIFAVTLLRERPGTRRVAGLVVAAAGIAVVGMGVRVGSHDRPVGAFLLVLAAGAAWGLSNVATRRAAPPDVLRFMVWVSAVAAPVDAVLSLVIEGPSRDLAALRGISLTGVAAIGYVAVLATLFGFGAWGALLRRYGPSTVAPYAMLAPVFAIAAGALVLGQPVHGTDVVGGAVVLGGIALGSWTPGSGRPLSRRTRPRSAGQRPRPAVAAAPAPAPAAPAAVAGTAGPAARS